MTINATAVYRARSTGNNANGAGYDAAISGTLSTTLSGAYTAGSGTFSVASASGWPSSGNYYVRIGNVGEETFSSGATGSSMVFLVTGGQGTTTLTGTAGQLGTTDQNFASGTVVDNDKSRCDTAELALSAGTANNTTTFSDVGATFDLTCVGNSIFLASGTNGTVGLYFIQSRTNTTTVVLDRAPSTAAMTNGVWKMGGSWTGDFRTRITSTWVKSGNQIFMRASGSGSVAFPDFTWADFLTGTAGDTTGGMIRWIGENGRPVWAATKGLLMQGANYNAFMNFFMVAKGASYSPQGFINSSSPILVQNVIADQNGNDVGFCGNTQNSGIFDCCEGFSSVANSGAAGSSSMFEVYIGYVTGCNVHDCWGVGINFTNVAVVNQCIVANCRGVGITANAQAPCAILNNTVNANFGHGISLASAAVLEFTSILGNIISNHTTAAKFGIAANFNSTAVNDRIRTSIDCNAYYNNTGNAQNLTIGTTIVNGMQLHDQVGVDPQFVSGSIENYAIGTNLQAKGYPQLPYTNNLAGKTAPTSYVDSGGVQRQESSSGSAVFGGNQVAIVDRPRMIGY